ncbi:MAG: dihydroorotate dehydrogenase [Actinomycetota bacterium]|nr:dihydroorotate dehydrogenase [Actinomycetota bacterium]
MSAELSVAVAGLELKNPVLAGSGEATATLEGLRAAIDAGAGAVVAKSANESEAAKAQLRAAEYALLDERWEPLEWGPAPRGASLFCRSGLVDEPWEQWVEILVAADAYASQRDAYVVPSLIAGDAGDAVRLARELEQAGLRWLEVNVGAPHAEEAPEGAIATDAELVGAVRQTVGLPVTVKGRPDQVDAAVAAGADAVCLATRELGFLPDPETRRPLLGTFAAIGGAWSLPLTLRHIAKARLRHGRGLCLVGTGGARDGLDVVRFLLAGASAVQLTTAVLTDGPAVLTNALANVEDYLARQGVSAAELVGEATDHVKTYEEVALERRH